MKERKTVLQQALSGESEGGKVLKGSSLNTAEVELSVRARVCVCGDTQWAVS